MIQDNPLILQQATELAKGNEGDKVDIIYPPTNLWERIFPTPQISLVKKRDSVDIYRGRPSWLFDRFGQKPAATIGIRQNEMIIYEGPARRPWRIGEDADARVVYRANPKAGII